MIRTINMKMAVAALLGALTLAAAPAALGTSGVANNGTFAANASLVCSSASCTSPDAATAGDSITASGSVSNLTSRYKLTTVTISLSGPAGLVYSVSSPVVLAPGKTFGTSSTLTLPSGSAPGTYVLKVAVDGISASGSLEVS